MVKRILFYMGILLGKPFIQMIFKLNRIVTINEKIIEKTLESGKSVILCSWHGRLLFWFYFFQNTGSYFLAGLHEDAEIISRIGVKMGYGVVRGSSSRGGSQALRRIIDILSNPDTLVLITPDGPKGPKQKVKHGAIRCAMITEAVIIPMSGQASRRWEAENWDTFVVPKPFGCISFVFGHPIVIDKNGDFNQMIRELENELNRLQELADVTVIGKT